MTATTDTITLPLSDLHARAKSRPAGYVEDVLGMAIASDDTTYTLRRADYELLCAKYRPSTSTLALVKGGAVGLSKAALGIDRASDEQIAARAAVCLTCEHRVPGPGGLSRCAVCKCIIAAKIRIASQTCPLAKW